MTDNPNFDRASIREAMSRGDVVIEPQFRSAGSFKEGLAPVRFNDNWTYIDVKTGRIAINDTYAHAGKFVNGVARIDDGGDNPRIGYIDKKGVYVWYPTR